MRVCVYVCVYLHHQSMDRMCLSQWLQTCLSQLHIATAAACLPFAANFISIEFHSLRLSIASFAFFAWPNGNCQLIYTECCLNWSFVSLMPRQSVRLVNGYWHYISTHYIIIIIVIISVCSLYRCVIWQSFASYGCIYILIHLCVFFLHFTRSLIEWYSCSLSLFSSFIRCRQSTQLHFARINKIKCVFIHLISSWAVLCCRWFDLLQQLFDFH